MSLNGLQAIVDGILTGGVYALMAAGLTLIFGVMDIINIAQGVMVVLGAYLSYVLSVHLGIGLLPGSADHRAGDVRARRRDRVRLHAPAARTGPDGDVDPRHLRGGDPHRGDPDARSSASTTCSCRRPTSTSSVHVLGFYLPVHLPDRLRAGGGAAGRPVLHALPDQVRPRACARRCRTAPPPT